MQIIEFIKMHGLGNDFVIIDNRQNNVEISKNIINLDPNDQKKIDDILMILSLLIIVSIILIFQKNLLTV